MKRIMFAVAMMIGVFAGTAQAQLRFNPNQVGILRWYRANHAATFGTGKRPVGLAFDGACIWVANASDNTISKMLANDGTRLGTFAVGNEPTELAFEGANLWVTNQGANTVTKLRASDGTTLGTFPWALPLRAWLLTEPTFGLLIQTATT